MTKRTMNVVKGAASGAAAGMLVSYLSKNLGGKHEIKKKAEKALGAMNTIVDTVTYMFK